MGIIVTHVFEAFYNYLLCIWKNVAPIFFTLHDLRNREMVLEPTAPNHATELPPVTPLNL